MGNPNHHVHLTADVLVIGGGPAGTWAALTARAQGAERAVLVDKGYCGTSGATASANTGVWYVAPEADARDHAIEKRLHMSEGLGRRETMAHVLETTWQQMAQLAAWGFPFRSPYADRHVDVDETALSQAKTLGSYAREMGWQKAKPRGAELDPTFRFRAAERDPMKESSQP